MTSQWAAFCTKEPQKKKKRTWSRPADTSAGAAPLQPTDAPSGVGSDVAGTGATTNAIVGAAPAEPTQQAVDPKVVASNAAKVEVDNITEQEAIILGQLQALSHHSGDQAKQRTVVLEKELGEVRGKVQEASHRITDAKHPTQKVMSLQQSGTGLPRGWLPKNRKKQH